QDVRISSINDRDDRAVEHLSAGSSKSSVVTAVVVNLNLGEHGKVLNLGLTQRRAVGGDENHLRLSSAESLQSRLVSKDSLSRLHNKLETRVHRLNVLLLLI
ncbi:hypothetical protein ACHAWT_001084, partial [Skeletonema menzelii]